MYQALCGFPLPTTVDRILFNGHEIIENCLVPLGYSQEKLKNLEIMTYKCIEHIIPENLVELKI